jgi:uncharacterized phiE125 gp8 family phage protein
VTDLTSIDKAKEWLGVSGAKDDALLTRLVTAVSTAVEEYVDRTLASTSYTETRDGPGGSRLSMPNFPITAVASVLIDGASIPVASSAIANGYLYTSTSIALRGYVFALGVQNVMVQYTAGFAAIPKDVEQACLDWLGHIYRSRDRIGHNSKSINGETVSFFVGPIPKAVEMMLKPYRRVAPC